MGVAVAAGTTARSVSARSAAENESIPQRVGDLGAFLIVFEERCVLGAALVLLPEDDARQALPAEPTEPRTDRAGTVANGR